MFSPCGLRVYGLRYLCMPEPWTILSDSYSRWAATSVDRFPPDFDLQVPSAKNLVLLALLENSGKECSYDDLQAAIKASGAVEGVIPKDNLRVAILDLRTKLGGTRFNLRTDRKGREAVLQLLEQDRPAPRRTYEVVRQLETPTADPGQIAWNLISTRALHHNQHFVLPRSASRWTTYSASETYVRSEFERKAYDRLFRDWLEQAASRSSGICVLGLNIGGEGDAELSILRDLLGRFETVHYLAIDLSGQLLADHAVYLNHQFGAEIQSGRLVCAVKAASFDEPLRAAACLAEVRAEFARKYPESPPFFPDLYPIFCSYLSNYIGNRSRPQMEWDVFNAVLSVFPKNPGHAFFVGFAQLRPDWRTTDEMYTRELFDFLVQTPRELLYNTRSLSSGGADEFKIPVCDHAEFVKNHLGSKKEDGKALIMNVSEYTGAGPITGRAYRFSYVTRYWLATENAGRPFRLKKGSEIHLYQVIKFDEDTLAEYLESMGLEVTKSGVESKPIGEGDCEHRYQLLSAVDPSHPPSASS
jgi:hypothetical protein